MTTLAELPEILTTEELAKALRVSKHTIYEEVRAGRLPVIRMSDRVWRYSKWAVERWLDGQDRSR
jgi:excisionase family DNA binding protein